MERREFVTHIGRTAAGLALLPFAGCGRDDANEAPRPDPALLELIADLEARIPDWLAGTRTPGLSMAIVREARIAWRGAFGVRDAASRTPVDHDTVFEAGSVSKTVFAYAAVKLCETGALNLDTPLTGYTPDRFLAGDARLDRITARHVLSHTSGFQNWRSDDDPLRIQFDPGSRWEYSGEAYSYLQSVVSHVAGRVDTTDCRPYGAGLRVCGTDFDAFMKTRLLVPFGMAASGYEWIPPYERYAARPHDAGGTPFERKATRTDVARYGAAGGLHTTATDYARFLIEVIDPKPADAFRLEPHSRAEMLRPQVRVSGASSWALGWQVEHHPGGDVLSHSGDNPGFKALAAASPSTRAALIVLTNSDRGFEVVKNVVSTAAMQQFLRVAV